MKKPPTPKGGYMNIDNQKKMSTIAKSLLYFACTIVMGNILLTVSLFMQNPDYGFENMVPSLRFLLGFPLVTAFFCLPLLIPILIFFTLMKTYRPYFPLNIFLAAAFGLIVSLGWMLVLNLMADWLEDYFFWGPFVVGATVSGMLVEMLFGNSQKPARLARSKNKAPKTLSQNLKEWI